MSSEEDHYLGKGGIRRWAGEPMEGGWTRKLGRSEKLIRKVKKTTAFGVVFVMHFETKMFVELDDIRRTSMIVARKMPYLRLITRKRNKEHWWKEMEELKVDVEEMSAEEITDDPSFLVDVNMDLKNGPLWFVKFVRLTEATDTNSSHDNASEENFKFACYFCFEHITMDGATNIMFGKVFLETLNRVVLKKEIDMKVEAEHVQSYEDMIADKYARENFLKCRFHYIKMILGPVQRLAFTFGRPLKNFTQYFPQPAKDSPMNHSIWGEIDKDATTNLMQKCKKENVTMNTAITAAALISFYKMSLTCGFKKQSTNYFARINVDMRRFWEEKEIKRSCGCHTSMFDFGISTTIEDVSGFWNFTRRIQGKVDKNLNEVIAPLCYVRIAEEGTFIYKTNKILSRLKQPLMNNCHINITNMGNVDRTFDGSGEVVEVTKIEKICGCEFLDVLASIAAHTFRGKLFYRILYHSKQMKKETAEVLLETLTNCLMEYSKAA